MSMMDNRCAAGPRHHFLASNIAFLTASGDGEDGICVVEHRVPHGDSPPLHVHRNEDEVFVVLEGRLRLQVGGEEIVLATGEAGVGPKGIAHSYRAESPNGARFLTVTRGRDFEGMLKALARPAFSDALPDPVAPSEAMVRHLSEVCAAHGIDLVGPPLS